MNVVLFQNKVSFFHTNLLEYFFCTGPTRIDEVESTTKDTEETTDLPQTSDNCIPKTSKYYY